MRLLEAGRRVQAPRGPFLQLPGQSRRVGGWEGQAVDHVDVAWALARSDGCQGDGGVRRRWSCARTWKQTELFDGFGTFEAGPV